MIDIKTLNRKGWWGFVLLAEISLLIFITPFFPETWHPTIYQTLYGLLAITTAIVVEKNKDKVLWAALALILVGGLTRVTSNPIIEAISMVLNISFFVFIVIFFIGEISIAKTVTKRVILDAINGYLLLGLVFTILLALMLQFDPEAFNFQASAIKKPFDIIYYGFITFATLGYGDLLPVKPYAKSLAILITISGQLYIAVIMALLVGKFASMKN